MSGNLSIFLDPTGRRARLTNRTLALMATILLLAVGALVTALSRSPKLPVVANEHAPVRQRPVIDVPAANALRYGALRDRSIPAQGLTVKRLAILETSQPGALNSLKQNAGKLDAIIPDWVRVSLDGRVALNGVKLIAEARSWLNRNAPSLDIYPQADFVMNGRRAPLFLLDEKRRDAVAAALANFASEHGFSGLTLTVPNFAGISDVVGARFLSETARRLNAAGKKLILNLDGGALDSTSVTLARRADFVLLDLTRDGNANTPEAPLASQRWFEAALDDAFTKIDHRKIIVSIGSYARDVSDGGVERILSLQQAWDRMPDAKAFRYDAAALNGRFEYTDTNSTPHTIWFLDAATNYNQMRTALARQPAGVALFRLGLEDPSVWSFVAKGELPNDSVVARLRNPEPAIGTQDTEKGAAFAISMRRSTGERAFVFDAARGLILDEKMSKIPSGAVVKTWGKPRDERVVLTFDDGPDARYTEPILDILKKHKVPAAFFIIGRNALANPGIMERLRDEGHEIGNHTFSHPNLKERTAADVSFELNATQRVLESQLGLRTVLFRAPYADMGSDGDLDAFKMMDQVSRMGYVAVRITIDPQDWANPTPSQIADRVLGQLARDDGNQGHIVLLHDAGGSRRSTIAALPVLIEAVRARGYKFVPLSQIIGKPRTELMPPTGTQLTAGLLSRVTAVGLGLLSWLSVSVPQLAVAAAILGILRLAAIIALALKHRALEHRRASLKWRPQTLTILVPAYNEETVVCKTIRSLLASRNRKFDIVVIDDGSSDNTAEAVRRAFWKTHRVRVFKKANGGKSAALNFGLRKTDAEIVIALDADTVFAPDAIEKLVRHFEDSQVGAVAGRAVVGNEVSMMARFQSLEYVTSQNLDRRAFERFNAIGVVPGAIGAWRRQPLLDSGGFPLDTLAEDADATIAIERAGWRVIYEPGAVALTEAPETVRAFLKQRFRWMYGTLQVSFKHRKALLLNDAKGVGCITIPNIVIFQFAFTLLAPLMDLLLAVSIMTEAREWMLSATGEVSANLKKIAGYWLLFQGIDSLLAGVGLALNADRRCWRLFPLIFIQRFFYRQLLYFVAIKTLLAAIRGQFVGWGKLLRTGNVQEAGTPLAQPA